MTLAETSLFEDPGTKSIARCSFSFSIEVYQFLGYVLYLLFNPLFLILPILRA